MATAKQDIYALVGVPNLNPQESSELDPADMISRLPDFILSHILSFLPTKYVVVTSVLSKRWEFVWTQIHSFDFQDDMPSLHYGLDQNPGQLTTFPQFVDRVMLLRNTQHSMETFRLRCCCEGNHINTWISSATAAGARELNLCVYDSEEVIQLPRRLYMNNRLVVLKLSGRKILINSQRPSFPFLKTLQLKSVQYQNESAFSQLISSCLMLENLLIEPDAPHIVIEFDISSHTLKHLTVRSKHWLFYRETGQVALKLDTPQLQFLSIRGGLSLMYDVKELPSLHEAHVGAFPHSPGLDFVRSLHNTKVLCLSPCSVGMMKILESFCNLTHLELKATFCLWGNLQNIVATTDNLKALTYEEASESCCLAQHWKTLNLVKRPCWSRLSSVSIIGFHGGRCNTALAKYILENAKALTKMEIRCSLETKIKDRFHSLQSISEMLPRVAATCKFTFS